MLPFIDGKPIFTGRVATERGRETARATALNALAVLRRHLGGLDRVRGIVRIGVHIASDPDFPEHAFIADGCSELLNQVFPESGKHARLEFCVASLPLRMPVELELIFEVGDE